MLTLKKCSPIWRVSEKCYQLSSQKLITEYNIDIERELEKFNPFNIGDFGVNERAGPNVNYFQDMNFNNDYYHLADDDGSEMKNFEELISKTGAFGGPPMFMTSNAFPGLEHLFFETFLILLISH